MIPVSVVIITRNEAHIISDTLASIASLTEDVVIVDSGSTDETTTLATAAGATILNTNWDGFGESKNKGIDAAKHDWILSIDADEQPDGQLINSLHAIDLTDSSVVYNIRFKTFLGKKEIRYGEWGNDSHIRFFNRTQIKWNNAKVHEKLVIPPGVKTKGIDGFIVHYTMKDIAEYATKMTGYALLNAEHYHRQGKKSNWIKTMVSPPFSFIKNYFFKLGFLDGREGFLIARITAFYTMLKYARLNELNNSTKNQ